MTARDHGVPPRSSHVDLVVVVDASIAYTDRQRAPRGGGSDADERFVDANLPFLIAALSLLAALVVIVIVLVAVAAAACGSRRTPRRHRQVPVILHQLINMRVDYHRRTAVPPCVNGDIAVQWEWSNFDPSQNQNRLTDYDKTLHN